jgi:hypothetical protein
VIFGKLNLSMQMTICDGEVLEGADHPAAAKAGRRVAN